MLNPNQTVIHLAKDAEDWVVVDEARVFKLHIYIYNEEKWM
mgnify:CR=1 FL=1